MIWTDGWRGDLTSWGEYPTYPSIERKRNSPLKWLQERSVAFVSDVSKRSAWTSSTRRGRERERDKPIKSSKQTLIKAGSYEEELVETVSIECGTSEPSNRLPSKRGASRLPRARGSILLTQHRPFTEQLKIYLSVSKALALVKIIPKRFATNTQNED